MQKGGLTLTNKGILAARDFIMPSFKFKPWQAVKIAKGANTFFAVAGAGLGIAIELWDSWSKLKQQEEFAQGIRKWVESFNKQRKEYLEFIDDQNIFITQFFPSYIELQSKIQLMETEMIEKEKFQSDFRKWRDDGEIIETDFEVIS